MLTVIWAGFTLLAVRVVKYGLTPKRVAGLALLALLAAALGMRGWIAALPTRAKVALAAGAVALTAAVLAGLISRAGVLDSTQGAGFNARQFVSYVWQFYLPKLPFMNPTIGPDYGVQPAFVETFCGVFASLEVRWTPFVYHALALASAAGLVALAVVVIRARRALPLDLTILLAAIPLALVAALHYAAYRNLQIDPGNPVIVGRYLFPLLPLFGVAIALVVRALPPKASVAVGTLILVSGALLGLSGLGMTAVRFYV
jgi:hypothetical protein